MAVSSLSRRGGTCRGPAPACSPTRGQDVAATHRTSGAHALLSALLPRLHPEPGGRVQQMVP